MRIANEYDGIPEWLELPDTVSCEIRAPRSAPERDPGELLNRALEDPVGSPGLEAFVEGAKTCLVVVNDATRPTPTALVLDAILPVLKDLRLTFLVATGAHRAPVRSEIQSIFGSHLTGLQDRIRIHDARDESSLATIGEIEGEGPIRMNRRVLDSDRILAVNSVEPHYFAGFTGGRKSFLPGIAGFSTIERNHRHAMGPGAEPMRLEGNPVHERMMQALEHLDSRVIFSVQLVLDRYHHLFSAHSGALTPCFDLAARDAVALFHVPVNYRADIVVVTVQPPKDVNLYQAQNALENARRVLRDGGILILRTACREGIGPDAFYRLLSQSRNPGELLEIIRKNYRLGFHKAFKWAETLRKASIWGVTNLPPGILQSIGVKSFPSLQAAVDTALQKIGQKARILFLPDGDKTVPLYRTTAL